MSHDRWNVTLFSFKNLLQVNCGVEGALAIARHLANLSKDQPKTPLSMCRQGKRSSSKNIAQRPYQEYVQAMGANPDFFLDPD